MRYFSAHLRRVAALQLVLKKTKGKISLSRTSNHTLRQKRYKTNTEPLSLSSFTHILAVDPLQKIAIVEPEITFEALCNQTLKFGCLPQVVPEFKTITVGGAVTGAAVESSSFRFGEFFDTCLEIEAILGNGECITASAKDHADFFYALSGSLGTLAILTAVTLKLSSVKKFVELTFDSFATPEDAIRCFQEKKEQPIDFLDGVATKPDHFVLASGNMQEEKPPLPQIRQKRGWHPWYYSHVCSATLPSKAYMEIGDYLFRYDHGAFWMGQYLSSIPQMARLFLHLYDSPTFRDELKPRPPPSPFFLALFGWAFSSHRLYGLWHRLPPSLQKSLFTIQDFYFPLEKGGEAIAFLIEVAKPFSLWLCPIKGTTLPQLFSPHYGDSPFYLNIGLYGRGPVPLSKIEDFLVKRGGKKMLYTSLTDAFPIDKIYDMKSYEDIRNKYFANEKFPSIVEKIQERFL